MSTAYSAPHDEAGPADPDFSPDTLCGADGRLLCVPEQILGVCLEEDGPELQLSVRRATRRLQLRHHPDRPHGSAFLSRLINISAAWLTDHRGAYLAWAATETGAAQLARATLAGPAPLRSPLTPAEERRVLAELDASAARQVEVLTERDRLREDLRRVRIELASSLAHQERLRSEREELRRERELTLTELDASASRQAELLLERDQLRQDLKRAQTELAAGAARQDHLLEERRQLEQGCEQACSELEAGVAREEQLRQQLEQLQQTAIFAQEEAARGRRRLASAEAHLHRERRAMGAVAGAAQAAELAAARAVERLRSRRLTPLLSAHLRQTAAGVTGCRARRTARRLLERLC
ncbi:hypothetical protein FJT64_015973 [Amphibalanus amphitrite]|uniref:J domain-containing protein n=1 Tax=Amphibalanus amphitrite TaxID=1232801 RepID=A0A6A4VFT8_AMPAM|nr:hypothetical protein FJT64_009286 [Amphibalanus amphitrite]KAF0313506.1 hypothetical protein FJT64_015973 [Amphibalanus amphitrite]